MKTFFTLIFTIAIFSQSIFAQCLGTPLVLNATTGSFSDGSGNSNYEDNLNCFWLISPNGAGSISLNFTLLDLELYQCSDKILVYDGTDTLSNLIATVCDVTNPGTITSTGGSMLLRFTSDISYSGAGWTASYTSTIAPPTFCNGNTTLTSTSGAFTDGSNNLNYSDNSNCTWLIQPPAAASITLSFSSFNTEDGYDFVKVYDNSISPPMQIASFSGNSNPLPVTLNTGGAMLVEFTSNNSITNAGWAASYTSSIAPPEYCSGSNTLTASSGALNDGSGASNYSDNADCIWIVQPVNTSLITLTFNAFNTEGGQDFVKIYDYSSSPPTQIASYSGNAIPEEITLPSSAMKVQFTANSSITDQGWAATYTSVNFTGIKENNFNETFSVFPNPFNQFATLKISSPVSERCEFIMYDMYGNSIKEITIPPFSNSILIDAKTISNGIYFYRISKNNINIHKGKLVLQ